LKKDILSGKSYSEIAAILAENGFEGIPAEKITYWIYRRKIKNFLEADNIPMVLRKYLNDNFVTGFYEPFQSFISLDGSRKYLFDTKAVYPVESVFIPDEKRNTVCISSQAGCRMSCNFCNTGRIGFHGNLETDEILNQVGSIMETERITHIVFMGMGEPLDNYVNILKSLDILTAQWGFAFSPRNITVSTIGLKPYLDEFIKDSRCNLAISVHTPFDEERDGLIPASAKYTIRELIDLAGSYPWEKNRRVTFQYIMIKGINDTDRHLSELIKLLKGTPVRVNLLSFHPPEGSMMCSSPYDIQWHFKHQLIQNGISAGIRKSRGQDIGAACGLLGKSRKVGKIL
jgi:23S rRNA (adenine2503-C2)-methyltransferase